MFTPKKARAAGEVGVSGFTTNPRRARPLQLPLARAVLAALLQGLPQPRLAATPHTDRQLPSMVVALAQAASRPMELAAAVVVGLEQVRPERRPAAVKVAFRAAALPEQPKYL